jgi:hypothetical protein
MTFYPARVIQTQRWVKLDTSLVSSATEVIELGTRNMQFNINASNFNK